MNNIYWIKRDFRLRDNKALDLALNNQNCMPLYIISPSFLQAPETSGFHKYAVGEALNDLDSKLRSHGGLMAFSYGHELDIFKQLHSLLAIDNIYAHEEIGNNRTFQIDKNIREWCKSESINFLEIRQTGVFRGLKDRNQRHKLWKKFYGDEILPEPLQMHACKIPSQYTSRLIDIEQSLKLLKDGSLSRVQQQKMQKVSESAANEALTSFLHKRGIHYSGGISSPLKALQYGSRLSAHLAWGTISGPTVYQALYQRIEELKSQKENGDIDAGKWIKSLRSFSSRLHWRDHFIQRLESEPNMEFQALNKAYDLLEYDNKEEYFDAWIHGRTGYPMVDACIRCLTETGFINFRMRAMLTSFACHSLSLDWKLIDKPMAQLYTDYEPGIHLSQLQMQASVVGINTVRIYSPDKQLIDQDPETKFVKEWIPELRNYTSEQIKNHGDKALGHYPAKIVDWREGAAVMRSRIFEIRKSEGYREIAAKVYEKHGSRKSGSAKRAQSKAK